MTLIKTSFLNAIAVGVRLLTLLGINKILAVYIGPAGYAALGQFQNAVQIITAAASGGINTGVTKYTAEYHEDEKKQHAIWRAAGTIALTSSIILSLIVLLFSGAMARWFLSDVSYKLVFVWFGLTLVFFVFNALLMAILNGKKDVKRYVVANIAGSFFSLLITGLLVVNWGLLGAFIALAIYQSLAFVVTLLLCYKTSWFRLSYLIGRVDKTIAKNLGKYMAMALTTALCVPLSHILIRNHLGETLGWSAAGYWEAMWRLSGSYLTLVTTTLAVYFLPKLSELKNPNEIKYELLNGYRTIMPIVLVAGVTVYLLRDWVIEILFSSQFTEMKILFGWQLVGDFLKIASWILSYAIVSKNKATFFIATEICFSVAFYILVVIFTEISGVVGVSHAHAMNYFIYLIVMHFGVLRLLKST